MAGKDSIWNIIELSNLVTILDFSAHHQFNMPFQKLQTLANILIYDTSWLVLYGRGMGSGFTVFWSRKSTCNAEVGNIGHFKF